MAWYDSLGSSLFTEPAPLIDTSISPDYSLESSLFTEPAPLIDPTIAAYAPDNSTVPDYSLYQNDNPLIGGLDNLGSGGSNYSFVQNAGEGTIYKDNISGGYTYQAADGSTYPLLGYGEPADSSGILDTLGGTLGGMLSGNLGGLLGRNTLGGTLGTLAGAGLTNMSNRQALEQQTQLAKDWYNMQREAELADMERMGVNKHLQMDTPVVPRQQTNLSGVDFTSAGTRPGGLAFFTDVKRGY